MYSPGRILVAVATGTALVVMHTAAVGQGRAPLQDGPDRPVDISVQYSIVLPLKDDDLESQRAVMEQGRTILYEISSRECTIILKALSSSCRLERLNVQSNPNRRRAGEDVLTLTANAQYKVVLKTNP